MIPPAPGIRWIVVLLGIAALLNGLLVISAIRFTYPTTPAWVEQLLADGARRTTARATEHDALHAALRRCCRCSRDGVADE